MLEKTVKYQLLTLYRNAHLGENRMW